MMRKFAAFFLILALLCLAGCGAQISDTDLYRGNTVIYIPADPTTEEPEWSVLVTTDTLPTELPETETTEESVPETTKATTAKKSSSFSSKGSSSSSSSGKGSGSSSKKTEPTTAPTTESTTVPTTAPTTAPTTKPTTAPTTAPTTKPTTAPTTAPTTKPTTAPTTAPTTKPTTAPTTAPTTKPTTAPTTAPATAPTTAPTTLPTTDPTTAPTTEPTTTPAETESPLYDISGYSVGGLETAMMDEINSYRAAEGLGELGKNSRLCAIASARAYEASLSWSHTRPNGTYFTTVFADYGFACGSSAENLLYTSGGEDGATLVSRWMSADGNRNNLMSADYTTIGIGVYYANGFTYIACLVVA